MWLEVGETEDSMVEAMCNAPECGLYGGGSVYGAGMWLEVGKTEDSFVDAMYQEPGCGWR